MKFGGMQKLTLLDFPGHTAATLFTNGCQLRCPFCHNAALVTEKLVDEYDEAEVLAFLKKRIGILDGVAITGGEPLLQAGLPLFIDRVREMGYAVKLDTNGFLPDLLIRLVEEKKVDYVAVDIKNCPDKYPETTGVPGLDVTPLKKTVEFLKNGSVPFEFRTTIVKEFHTPEDIEKIGRWIAGTKNYFLQNFVDSGNLIGADLHPQDKEILKEMLAKARLFVPDAALRGVEIFS